MADCVSTDREIDLAKSSFFTPIAATILAAGLGKRLGGKPKAALKIDGLSMLEHLIAALRSSGVSEVSVIIGPYQETLLPLVSRSGARAVIHQQHTPSLIDSQRLALASHTSNHPAHDLLLVLADLPLLRAGDILNLLNHWAQRAQHIHSLFPIVEGVRGHPLLISDHAAKSINTASSDLGIRDWLSCHPESVWTLESSNHAYITDVDTNEDLALLQTLMKPASITW